MKRELNDAYIGLYVPSSLKKKLVDLAVSDDRRVAEVIRRALKAYLKGNGKSPLDSN